MAQTSQKRISIRDVAKASGVSLTTVSLVLNKSDQRISEQTRQRVLDTIRKLGYRPNRLAQGLQTRRSHILAILVPQLSHTFADVYFGELISGIYDHADRSGYKILLEVAGDRFVRKGAYEDLYEQCFIDGMLFMGSDASHTFVEELGGPNRPFMLVNNVIGGLDHVVCDYAEAGRLAAEHLAELGHRRIAMIRGSTTVHTANELTESFTAALRSRRIMIDHDRIEDGLFTEEGGADATRRLLARAPHLSAIFAGNDKMAIGAIQALLDMGKRVPHDLSVMGCDDIHQASFVTPPLTTVHTPLYELGERCGQRLIELLTGQRTSCREVMPVEMKVRGSTGRAADVA